MLLNSEEARKVGDQGGILQIVKLKRRRTRLGELDSVIFIRMINNVYLYDILIVFTLSNP